MAVLTSRLIISLIDRLTGPSKAIAARLGTLQAAATKNAAAIGAMRGKMIAAVGASVGLAMAIRSPIKAAIEYESAMADIRKVVDFPTPQAFKQLGDDILELSKRIPIAANGLAAITAAAGAAGMKGGELLAFTEMTAKLATAFDMTAADAGTAMAKLKTSFGISVAQTSALADSLNHLSNNMASTAPNLIDYMKRVGVQGEFFGFSATQTAALGSAMIAAGAESEVAATSFRNVGKALTQGDDVTKKTAAAFKKLGLTSMQVTKGMQKNAVGVFNSVLKRIAKIPKHLQPALISEIFGDEARAIAPLIGNHKLLADSIALVAKESDYLGSAQKEFEARAATTANGIQLFKNRINILGITIGSIFLPAINRGLKALEPLIDRVTKFAKENPKLTQTIIGVAGGLVALRVAAIGAGFAFAFLRGGAILLAITSLRALGAAARFATIMMWPLTASVRAVRTALVALAFMAPTLAGLKALGLGMLAVLSPVRLVTGALRLLKLALLGTGIGAILLAIGTAGTFIYNNWEGVKALFSGIGAGIMDALQPVMPVVQPVIDGFKWLSDIFGSLTGKLDASNASWTQMGFTIGQKVGGAIKTVIDLIKSLFGWLGKIPGAIGRLGSSIGGAVSNPGSVPGIDGALASGGPVKKGGTYLVGERGPELFTPNVAGAVHNTHNTMAVLRDDAMASMPSGAGGGGKGSGGVNNSFGGITITVHGAEGQSAKEIAGEVERIFSAKLAATSRGSFSDGAYA